MIVAHKTSLCLSLCALLVAISFTADAQQPGKVPRIGILLGGASGPDPRLKAFREGLRDLGHVDGKTILIEYRYGEGKEDRLSSLVAELVQLKVDVIVVTALSTIRAAKQATKTIPIVIVTTVDPVATGIIDSLARPGGNITGLATLERDLSGKRLELLKEIVPNTSRIGILRNVDSPGSAISVKQYDAAAQVLKIQLQSLELRGPNPDLEGAFQAAAKARVSAVMTVGATLLQRYAKRIADLAIENRLPLMCERSHYVEAGALASYSASDADQYRRAATYVDRILKGAKPADLPIEQPTKFEMLLNLKTAKQISLTIPQSVLYRADRVIK